MCSTLRSEFRVSHLSFNFDNPRVFYTAQWKWHPAVFIVFRLIWVLFSLGTTIANGVLYTTPGRYPFATWLYLTTWVYTVMTLHHIVAFVVALHGYIHLDQKHHGAVKRDKTARAFQNEAYEQEAEVARSNHKSKSSVNGAGNRYAENGAGSSLGNTNSGKSIIYIKDGLIVSQDDASKGPGIAAGGKNGTIINDGRKSIINVKFDATVERGKKNATKGTGNEEQSIKPTPWYMSLTWFLASLSFSSTLVVSAIFFSVIAPSQISSGFGLDPISINTHGVSAVMVIIDLLVSACPVRIVHMFYPSMLSFIYLVFGTTFWAVDPNHNAIYPRAFDWNYPGTTGLLVAIALFASALLHVISYGIYRLRLKLYRKIYNETY